MNSDIEYGDDVLRDDNCVVIGGEGKLLHLLLDEHRVLVGDNGEWVRVLQDDNGDRVLGNVEGVQLPILWEYLRAMVLGKRGVIQIFQDGRRVFVVGNDKCSVLWAMVKVS